MINNSKASPITGFLRTMIRYTILTTLLTVSFCLCLYLSGLCNENLHLNMRQNLKESIVQLKLEGDYPRLFNSQDHSYRLDNYTDSIILQQAYLMDTQRDPHSIFSNPYVNKTYNDDETSDRILSLEEARKTETGNAHYTHYWLGIRAIIRPLLYFFNYQSIRGIISIGFITLWLISSIMLYRSLGTYITAAYFAAIVTMNIPIVSSEIQFVTCFFVMFLSVIALLLIKEHRNWIPCLFFITGAVTQYLDFYTYPVVTLGFPLLISIFLFTADNHKNKFIIICKCIFAWFAGYALFWMIRLLLVQLFTEHDDTIYKALNKLFTWTGTASNDTYSKYTIKYSMQLCFETLFKPHNTLFFVCVMAYYFIAFVHRFIRRDIHQPQWLCILVAIIPLLWISVVSRATGNHYWFQYRLMSVFSFAILSFCCSFVFSSNKHTEPHPNSLTKE